MYYHTTFMRWGALFGFLGVMLGAFGAHSLRAVILPDLLHAFETGVRYQLIHALALMLCSLLSGTGRVYVQRAGYAFIAGIILFSGSLYLLALTGNPLFGPITPVGGIVLMIGWVLLIVQTLQKN